MAPPRRIRVSVVVVGDVGRSPRMLYHAHVLASDLADVDVIGYAGSDVHPTIRDHERIRWHHLRPVWRGRRPDAPRLVFLLGAAWKALSESAQLLWILLGVVDRPDFVLVQNPPAVPTLLIAVLAARLRRARLVIDWHNFGHSMLALRLGPGHRLVGIARRYERVMGRLADAHVCVSRAMRAALERDWGIRAAVVLHDRPATFFAPPEPRARADILCRLRETIGLAELGGRVDRGTAGWPALVVSPTSWTADEDFSMLLEAARRCDEMFRAESPGEERPAPRVLVLVTGRGPLRSDYETKIARLDLRHVHIRTAWLAAEDYPQLLAASDLGLCLHRSSSGVDLPMKVADMLGSALPVCALDYGPCLAEQLQHGVNGLLFRTSDELAQQLHALFGGSPAGRSTLDELRANILASPRRTWADEWRETARGVFAR